MISFISFSCLETSLYCPNGHAGQRVLVVMVAPWTWALHLLSIYVLDSFAHRVWSTLCYFNILIMWYEGRVLDLTTSKELDSSPSFGTLLAMALWSLNPSGTLFPHTQKDWVLLSRRRAYANHWRNACTCESTSWTVAPDKIWENVIIAPYALQVFCNETLLKNNLWCLFTCQGMSSLVLCFLFCSLLPFFGSYLMVCSTVKILTAPLSF